MSERVEFTAGITLRTGAMMTVDVTALDAHGIRYRTEEGTAEAAWEDVKAVMLATTDHMLETAGYMLEVSDMLREQEQRQPYDAEQMRDRALRLLGQVAPRICPRGDDCPLAGDR